MSGNFHPSFKHWFLASIALIGVTFLAWNNALSGYFIADDAWHVPLVDRALSGEPGLLFRQFVSPYSFHESLYRMYRPLTDFSFALDCFLWKGNAFGYHLQNLIWHAISACLVFAFSRSLLVYVVLRDVHKYNPLVLWKIPLMVSLLFVVYPGHAEPVCWALPRIDLIGAAFTFLSLTCVLEFFERPYKKIWFIAAIVSMFFGLMIKEMSASIPFVTVALYLITRHARGSENGNRVRLFFTDALTGLKLVWPMFVLLAIYIAHRAFSLGSLIGGYQGTIGASLNSSFLPRLFSIEACWRLFHPVNENVLGSSSTQDFLIRVIYLLFALLLLLSTKSDCFQTRLRGAGKLLFLLFVMVLPCLQIWGVTGGLIGARHAYTLCVPFILAVIVLIYPITSERSTRITRLRRAATAVVWAAFMLFFSMSQQYAKAWSEATGQISKLRNEIEEHALSLSENHKLVVAGLPTGIKGFCAFYTIDFLPGLLMPPLSRHDVRSKVICIDGTPTNDTVINRSLLKHVLQDESCDFNVWVNSEQHFVSLHIPILEYPLPDRSLKIREIGTFARHREVSDGTTFFGNKTAGDELQSFILKSEEKTDPMDFEVLELKVTCENGKPIEAARPLSVLFPDEQNVTEPFSLNKSTLLRQGRYGWVSWSGALSNQGESALPVYFPVFTDQKSRTYKINLTQYKNWLFSGASDRFRIDLPARYGKFKIESAVLKQATDYIPELSFAGKGRLETNGLYATSAAEMSFSFDATKIPDGKKVLVEVSLPYYEFHVQPHTYRESTRSEYVSYTTELDELSGTFVMPPQVVSKPAYYQVRICAIDGNGDPIGSFSDPVTVSNVVLPLGCF